MMKVILALDDGSCRTSQRRLSATLAMAKAEDESAKVGIPVDPDEIK